MPRKNKFESFVIRVIPDQPWYDPDDDERESRHLRRTQEVIASIKRHVDDVADIDYEAIIEPICEHCGAQWTEESSSYNGGCCEEDIEFGEDNENQ